MFVPQHIVLQHWFPAFSLVTAVTDKFLFPEHTVAMKPGKLFHSEFGGYGEAVVSLLSFGLAVAILYELIRVACAHLFK